VTFEWSAATTRPRGPSEVLFAKVVSLVNVTTEVSKARNKLADPNWLLLNSPAETLTLLLPATHRRAVEPLSWAAAT
jgi:hypothetical protein